MASINDSKVVSGEACRPTPAAPDRLRRGYAGAICQVSCYDDFVALQSRRQVSHTVR